MRLSSISKGFMAAGLLSACLLVSAAAQDIKSTASPNPSAKTTAKLSPGVDEILKMMQAGVSTQVMLNYVENSPLPYRLAPADIIILKQQGVPDDITTALLKRGAAVRSQMSQANEFVASSGNTRQGSILDPESYDFFQYYYLYPRALAAANQRLYSPSPYYSGVPGYAYGSEPPPFQAFPPSVFRRR